MGEDYSGGGRSDPDPACEIDATGGTPEHRDTRTTAARADGDEEPAAILRRDYRERSAWERNSNRWSGSRNIAFLRLSGERKETEHC